MGPSKVPKLSLNDPTHYVDNSTSTIQKLYQLYQDPVLSDLQLIVGDERFFAHKVILSISSDVFKTMLTNPTWPESYTDKIYLEEEPQCIAVFEDFLQYLYTGKISLSHTYVLPVLILADKYNISDLSTVCVEYMCTHFIAPKHESCVLSWLDYSTMCNHKNLEKACESYVTSNFQHVLETDEFLSVSSDMLLRFLKSSDIVLMNEMSLFRYTLKWIQKNISVLDNPTFLKQIVSLLRHSLISQEDVLALEDNMKQAIINIHRLTGVSFLAIELNEEHENVSKIKDGISNNDCPRIYTCDAWCTEMVVPDISNVQPGQIYGAFFSTPNSPDIDNDESWDWHLNLYPRGVLFKGCMMIGLYGNHSIDEVIYERVRLAITSDTPDNRAVKVTVLVYGHENGVEYVAKALTKTCLFNKDQIIYHVNDLVDFNELDNKQSSYLLGENHDSFKIKIIIRPISSSFI